jgi:hypothetical protein
MQEHHQALQVIMVKQEQLTPEVVEVELHLLMVLQQELVEQVDLV